jgi:mono/diheme cytochrome c family protein
MLVRLGAQWKVASTPVLEMIRACLGHMEEHQCHNGIGNILVLDFIEHEVPMAIQPPAAVGRAGKQKVREFNAGATVAMESGCLACHRIGDQGNKYPGPSLTHIGSRLTKTQIEEAIVSSLAPMPSFRRLPKEKFHALVRFLELLR